MNMKPVKKLHLLHSLLVLNVILGSSIPHHNHTNYCGNNITTQTPFLNPNSSIPSLLSSITLCRSQNLYFRTSLGLFHVSSVDYSGRFLTITHSSCPSSSLQYVPPLAVTAGFPSPPEPNSLILFNCSSRRDPISVPFMQNCSDLYKCGGAAASSSSSRTQKQQEKYPYSSCLVVEDVQIVDKGFHPKQLNCSHYSWAHKSSSDGGHNKEGYKFGIRITFDIHAPDICKGCEKSNNSNCGAGLKCVCHAKECSKCLDL